MLMGGDEPVFVAGEVADVLVLVQRQVPDHICVAMRFKAHQAHVTAKNSTPFSLVDECRTVVPLCVYLMEATPYFLLYSVRCSLN